MMHQMTQPINGNEPEQMNGQFGQTLSPMEPWRDETRYSMTRESGTWEGQEMPQEWGTGTDPAGLPQGMTGTGGGYGPSSAYKQSQRMKNPVDMETTHNPTNKSDAYQASLRSLLARNVGYFIVATFLTGTQRMVTWQGILHTVGTDYLVIYQPDYERYISCDFYALKFAQFHNTQSTPYCASAHTWMGKDF